MQISNDGGQKVMDFGMPFLLENASQEDCVELCNKLGLQFIEWNMNFPQCQLEQLDANRLKQIHKETGIYYTIHLDENLNISEFNPKVKQAYLDIVRATIELARQIDAPIINMHLAKGIYITLPTERVFLYKKYHEFYMQNMINFRAMCESMIGDSKIMIAIENTDGFEEYEKQAIEVLLQSKCFGLTLDIGHSHVVKDMDIPFYEKHISRLIHMHAHDANSSHNHLAFGDGEVNLRQRLDMANKANARVVLETKTIEALTNTVSYIHKNFNI